jgi:diguanylate cyclase (GGDEF)-like protein
LNRRRFTRQPISLSALVHPAQGRSWLCTIRDFCEQGMLLTGSGATRSLSAAGGDARPGDPIAIHFSVPTPTGQQHFRTQASIARLLESGNGIGVVFDEGLPKPAFDALIEFGVASGLMSRDEAAEDGNAEAKEAGAGPAEAAQRAPRAAAREPAAGRSEGAPAAAGKRAGHTTAAATEIPEALLRDRRITEARAVEIRGNVREVLERALNRGAQQFFGIASSELLVSARDASTNAVQMMYMEGLDQLEKSQDRLIESFVGEVLRQVDQISDLEEVLEKRRRRQSGDTTKLQLVDTDQFEEWLSVAEIISKAENRYSEQLLDMRAQLGLIAKPWTHKDAVPVGPAVIAWSFDDAIRTLDLRKQVRKDILRYFEQVMLPVMGSLYSTLGELFESSGAFPSATQIRESLARSAVRRSPSGVRVEPDAYRNMDSAVREAAMAADGFGGSLLRHDLNPFQPVEARPAQAYSTARSLLNLSRRARALRGQPADEALAPPETPEDQTFRSADVIEALAEIERELGDAPLSDRRLKPRLIEILRTRHGDRKGFREEDYDTLDVMENLVRSLETDHYLTQGIREWIRRLEITLNKLAARDPEFLQHEPDRPHSAVLMLNQLARLGNAQDVRDGIDREVGRRVDELLQRVVKEFDRNPGVFAEVVDELNPLVDRQVRAYRGNVERTVRASEGQQKLARARRAVLREMHKRLAGRQVPDLVLHLLNPGWRNLLVHTHLRRGPDSHEWRDQLAIVDQLAGQLSGDIEPGSEAHLQPDKLLKRVVEGLNSISFDPSKRTPLIMALSDALVGDTTGKRAKVSYATVDEGEVAAVLGLEGLLQALEPRIDAADESVQESWGKAVERARHTQVGEWLATSDAQGRPLILTIAFVGDEANAFVLVNRKGVKVRELTLQEMAEGLHQGRITLLEDYDLPLMERASQRMIEDMHSQLAYQASHDDLTQLMNRKEFEREVGKAIQSARARDRQHALLYLDLDQFKIVNNTSGHTAGDELLKLIADTLVKSLADEPAKVARLGGDEFGVLAENIGTSQARNLAEQLLNAIRAERFEWDGRMYTLSASMGLVFVDQTTESVDLAMQYADEACYAAKDAGRNRVQEYELGDSVIRNRHGIMEWVTQLDRALSEDRLLLNCQRIAPTNGADPATSHFEILLTMVDEMGDTMPPADFILAAETYQRMTAIDRWVIERVLRWMSDHRDQLDHFGGFAINVSGHSINDEAFPDFVLEQFSLTQAPTSKVCFEITETAAIANLDNAREFMNRMKIIGCRFSLDDFGTGLSSYSYLRNLPVDYVKIDGVFVRDIVDNPGDYAVVRSINEIGHYMGKQTIAECVESDAVLEKLKEVGVDFVQGYHIDKPTRLEQLSF